MVGRITKRAVDALKSGAALWDRDVRGFVARRRAGDVVVYAVKFRARGRQRWYRIGPHGSPWTPDTARTEAQQVLAAVARGEDPASSRHSARRAPTVADLADRFLAEHADAKLRSGTAHEYRRLFDAIIRPALGPRRVADVTRADVARLHHRYRSTPVQANRAVAILAKAFALSERWQMRAPETNPARGIEKYREIKRTRRLTIEELGRLGAVLTAADAGPIEAPGPKKDSTTKVHVSPFAIAAIRLLCFTGARKNEILSATWDMVDRERAVLHLADSKTGPKDILLPAPALAVLDGVVRIEGNPFILPGAREGRGLVNISKPLHAILTAAALGGVTLHVMRHSFASIGVDAGLSLPVVGKLLGHAQAATTQRYAHVEDPVRAAGELVAGRIASALGGEA